MTRTGGEGGGSEHGCMHLTIGLGIGRSGNHPGTACMDDTGAWWSEVASTFLFGVLQGRHFGCSAARAPLVVVYASSIHLLGRASTQGRGLQQALITSYMRWWWSSAGGPWSAHMRGSLATGI